MDDKKRVNIKYQYYQLCTFDGDEYTENLYDLVDWMRRISTIPKKETVHEVEGVEGRVENIELIYDDKFYALNFMRLDVISNNYILTKDGDARHIDLKDDEYIGKNTVMIYDPKFSIAMIQCNRGSYGPFSLQNYINSFNYDGILCYFRPIYDGLNMDNLSKSRAIKLDVRFSNIKKFKPKTKFFERIINSCEEIDCLAAHIECSLGYIRNAELDKETVFGVISDLRNLNNKDAISSAKIKLSGDQQSGIIDIFENIFNDNISYVIPARKELDFSTMVESMLSQYYEKGSRNKLYRLLE